MAIVIAGDFNCAISPSDYTGTPNISNALAATIKGLALHDAYKIAGQQPQYTHYTNHGASRIDRIYISANILNRKKSTETLVAPFTDHMAVVLHLTYDHQSPIRKNRRWRMNISLLDDTNFRETLKLDMLKWRKIIQQYPDVVSWWDKYVKGKIRKTFQVEGAVRNTERRTLENFYYDAIYQAIRDHHATANLRQKINRLKAKILRLTSKHMRGILLDTVDTDALQNEAITTYHYIRSRKRAKMRNVSQILDDEGNLQEDHDKIMKVFTAYLGLKYSNIECDGSSYIKLVRGVVPTIHEVESAEIDGPITEDELWNAISKGKRNKSPGPDGICHEYYKHAWEYSKHDFLAIMNKMYMDGQATDNQKKGNIVCLPKTDTPLYPENYRPLTLLNTDYKILMRIIANRLRPSLEHILHPSQYCGRYGKTIHDAIATTRDIIAYAEHTNHHVCLLSIDFRDAFDRISHDYLFKILREYGISDNLCTRLRGIYADATSILTLNGQISKPIHIHSGVRQGCPLSMLLFAACINPLLYNFERKLQGVNIRQNSKKTTAIAYADDVTIIMRHQGEIEVIKEILHDYMKASGARININKSSALALGSWTEQTPLMNIKYEETIKLLGFKLLKRSNDSAKATWDALTNKIRIQAKENYQRALNLEKRVRYVNEVLLATAWYTSQIYPPPNDNVRQINAAIAYFIWKGEIFRVPLSTLQKPKALGGRALTNIMVKSITLFLLRMEEQQMNHESFTADWLRYWFKQRQVPNPPDKKRIPAKLEYLYRYNIEAAYMSPKGTTEGKLTYKKRIYQGLLTSIHEAAGRPEMRIQKIWPETDWTQVWKNLHDAPISEDIRCTWYTVIHDLTPTNERLHRINMTSSNKCQQCDSPDNMTHRLTECGEGEQIWQYTATLIARMLRTRPSNIPVEWLLRPQFQIWPPKRSRAILWTLANTVTCRMQQNATPTLQEFMDFMRRSRWKMTQNERRLHLVGNYLTVMDPHIPDAKLEFVLA